MWQCGTHRDWLCAAAMLVCGVTAHAADEDTQYFLTTYHGQVIGVRVVRTRPVTDDGRSLIETQTDDQTRLSARGVTTRTVTSRTELTDLNGRAVSMEEKRVESGQVFQKRVRVTDDAVEFRTRVAGRQQAFRTTRDGPVMFDLDGSALKHEGRLAVGQSLTRLVIAQVELGIAELTATVEEEMTGDDGQRLFKIRVGNSNGAGESWELVCDEQGRTRELRIGPMLMRSVSRKEARFPRSVAVLENRIPTEHVSHLDDIRTMRVFATVPPDARDDVFMRSIYCNPWQEPDGRFRLTLNEVRPDGRIPREELSDELRDRYLSPTPMIESTDEDIREKAEDIVDNEPEQVVQALLLARWVYRSLAKRSTGPATASALEALQSRAGDCTEHASLFTAFARAVGIPARQALGLVHDGEGFQFHAWSEIYADGRWIPVDPTLGRMGVPGIYILLGREGDKVEYHSRANSLQGRTSMMLIDTR